MGWDWLSKVTGLLGAPLVLIKTLMFIGRKVGTIEYFIKCMDANMLCAKSVQRNICFHKDLQSVLLCSQHFKTFNLSLSTRNICFNIKMRPDSFQNWEEEEDSFLFQGTTLRLRSRPSEVLLFTEPASFLRYSLPSNICPNQEKQPEIPKQFWIHWTNLDGSPDSNCQYWPKDKRLGWNDMA